VPLPVPFRIIVAAVLTLIASIVIIPAATVFLSPELPFLISVGVVLAGLLYAIVSYTMGFRIKISQVTLLRGGKADVLQLRGNDKGDRLQVPCEDIIEILRVNYTGSHWKTFFLSHDLTDSSEGYAMRQTGYAGPGLSVTYRFKPLIGSEEKTSTIQFPTMYPEELTRRLNASRN